MNRVKFWTLIGISSLTLIVTLVEISLALTVQAQQIQLQTEGPQIQRGQQAANTAQAVANRVYLVGQQQHDQKLMDLLSRHGVIINVPPSLPSPSSSTAPSVQAPATAPEPHY